MGKRLVLISARVNMVMYWCGSARCYPLRAVFVPAHQRKHSTILRHYFSRVLPMQDSAGQ